LQYTAAALVNELATRAMPAAVHSIPTCANTEDHVSMGANDARHAYEALTLLGEVLLLERLALLQALRLRLWSLTEWARNAGGDVPAPKAVAEAKVAGIPLRWSDGLLLGDLQRLRGVLGLAPVWPELGA
jgi:histidine ammonia-lyase